MSLGQVATRTDTGRKRRHNEDAYVCKPPLFAVADGMGGAQAGEVASRLAAAALREHPPEGGGEDRVAALIQEANRRVYEQSSENPELSGMGTTLTAAIVDDGRVWLGHVGDSRAYLIRDGKLEQLTQDHSLVAELTRAGKLSEEEAEIHPQRSVITRALGTDPDVEVDTLSIETRDGDLFMICSDGLTSMVEDKAILDIVNQNRKSIDRVARALVKAANRGGGEDNITVVLFEISEDAERTRETVAVPEPEAEEEDGDEDTLSGIEGVPTVEVGEPLDEWATDGDAPQTVVRPSPFRKRRRRRRAYWLAGFGVLVIVIGLLVFGFSQAHFVGAQKDGHVAVYQGVPYDVAGIHLYRTVYVSPLLAAQLTQPERRRLFDHSLRSSSSARDLVNKYEHLVQP
jgi:PPM family protein phosphatase